MANPQLSPAPAAPAGPTPDLALTYSSGSVDGMTLSANAQASTVGTGWELSPPFIERSFASCHNYLSTHPAWGDLCYPGLEVASLVVNGSSSPLVFVGTIITQLFGGSAGREGTAIQMSGSLTQKNVWN